MLGFQYGPLPEKNTNYNMPSTLSDNIILTCAYTEHKIQRTIKLTFLLAAFAVEIRGGYSAAAEPLHEPTTLLTLLIVILF